MSRPQSKLVEPEVDRPEVMQGARTVLRDRDFVQMRRAVHNKFKWSVAGGMHPGFERSQSGTATGNAAPTRRIFILDALCR
jgi:hypothetical protein